MSNVISPSAPAFRAPRRLNVGTRFSILAAVVAAVLIATFTIAMTQITGNAMRDERTAEREEDEQVLFGREHRIVEVDVEDRLVGVGFG